MLTNRQPTLHKPGMMGHRARIMRGEDAPSFSVFHSFFLPDVEPAPAAARGRGMGHTRHAAAAGWLHSCLHEAGGAARAARQEPSQLAHGSLAWLFCPGSDAFGCSPSPPPPLQPSAWCGSTTPTAPPSMPTLTATRSTSISRRQGRVVVPGGLGLVPVASGLTPVAWVCPRPGWPIDLQACADRNPWQGPV